MARAPSELVMPLQQAIEQIDGIKEWGRIRLRKARPITFVDIVCHPHQTTPPKTQTKRENGRGQASQ